MVAIDNDYIEIDTPHWREVPEFSTFYENFISETPKEPQRSITDGLSHSVLGPARFHLVDDLGSEVAISQ